MANEKSYGIKLKVLNDQMSISANHSSLGEASEVIPVNYQGKELEIGFNAKYLIDTITSIDGDNVHIELNNEISPVIVKTQTDSNYLGIIMPLKL
mgnify:CR=1 FL=1